MIHVQNSYIILHMHNLHLEVHNYNRNQLYIA